MELGFQRTTNCLTLEFTPFARRTIDAAHHRPADISTRTVADVAKVANVAPTDDQRD